MGGHLELRSTDRVQRATPANRSVQIVRTFVMRSLKAARILRALVCSGRHPETTGWFRVSQDAGPDRRPFCSHFLAACPRSSPGHHLMNARPNSAVPSGPRGLLAASCGQSGVKENAEGAELAPSASSLPLDQSRYAFWSRQPWKFGLTVSASGTGNRTCVPNTPDGVPLRVKFPVGNTLSCVRLY